MFVCNVFLQPHTGIEQGSILKSLRVSEKQREIEFKILAEANEKQTTQELSEQSVRLHRLSDLRMMTKRL